ncbi:MAG: site-specific integrase, partial [Candidatus Dadabacteria bacterium]|nr:site-specific integrase [Candidatus Dadabacteria bacterium]
TGMRRSEIARLRWQDIDLEERTIYVAETKNDEPRTIPMSESLFNSLLEMKNDAIGEYVFTTPDGNPYTSLSAWKRAWSTALRNSGIEKGRFHDFRHTFISNLIVKEKEDFATVMALSGHKDITMLKRYSHTQEEAKKAAINKLGKHFEKSTIDTYMDTKADIDAINHKTVIALTPSDH